MKLPRSCAATTQPPQRGAIAAERRRFQRVGFTRKWQGALAYPLEESFTSFLCGHTTYTIASIDMHKHLRKSSINTPIEFPGEATVLTCSDFVGTAADILRTKRPTTPEGDEPFFMLLSLF